MSSPKIEVAVKNACPQLGEGPHWDPATQSLWFVDIEEGTVGNWDSNTGNIKLLNIDGLVGFAIPAEDGSVVAAKDKSIVRVDPATNNVTLLADFEPDLYNRFNDAKCDSSGRLWAGTMGRPVNDVIPNGAGSLYSFGSDHKAIKHVGDLTISNGIDWTDDNSVMYLADSRPQKIYAFDFDLAKGTLSNQRTVIDFANIAPEEQGVPDGLCIDSEGMLWVAVFDGSKVFRCDPTSGKLLQKLEFPVTNITSVCFGGKNLDELFVTSSMWKCPNPEKEPLAGSIFRVTGLGVKGRPGNKFRG